MLLKQTAAPTVVHWFLFPGIDKVVHFVIFAILGFLLKATFPKLKTLYFFYIVLIYAFLTEILQDEMKLGRSLETMDIVADFLGATVGFLVYRRVSK